MQKETEKKKGDRGFVKLAVIVLIGLLVISYMGISVKDVVESPAGQSNFQYIKDISVAVWERYFEKPLTYFYREIWIELMWEPFIEALRDIKNGRPTSIEPEPVILNQ